MRSLPATFITEKNKLSSGDPTVLLLKVQIAALDPIYLARNTEDIVSNGVSYLAFWFELDVREENSKGNLPEIQLRVNNATRALEYYFDAYDGLVDAEVTVSAVNTAYPDDVALAIDADIMASSADDHWIYLTLGTPSPLRFRFPPEIYIAEHCSWRPGGPECGKPEAANVCKRTRPDCLIFNNVARFGGEMGLANPGVRLA
jgi:phage-related protein